LQFADAGAVLRIPFSEPGPSLPLTDNERGVSSRLVEIETGRAVDRERLIGKLDDMVSAGKRKELADQLPVMASRSVRARRRALSPPRALLLRTQEQPGRFVSERRRVAQRGVNFPLAFYLSSLAK
jgi:hypothetical protein